LMFSNEVIVLHFAKLTDSISFTTTKLIKCKPILQVSILML